MCFHGNQLSWAIKHPIIRLCLKCHSPGFICFLTILAPVISSLDEIYCIWYKSPYGPFFNENKFQCSSFLLQDSLYLNPALQIGHLTSSLQRLLNDLYHRRRHSYKSRENILSLPWSSHPLSFHILYQTYWHETSGCNRDHEWQNNTNLRDLPGRIFPR